MENITHQINKPNNNNSQFYSNYANNNNYNSSNTKNLNFNNQMKNNKNHNHYNKQKKCNKELIDLENDSSYNKFYFEKANEENESVYNINEKEKEKGNYAYSNNYNQANYNTKNSNYKIKSNFTNDYNNYGVGNNNHSNHNYNNQSYYNNYNSYYSNYNQNQKSYHKKSSFGGSNNSQYSSKDVSRKSSHHHDQISSLSTLCTNTPNGSQQGGFIGQAASQVNEKIFKDKENKGFISYSETVEHLKPTMVNHPSMNHTGLNSIKETSTEDKNDSLEKQNSYKTISVLDDKLLSETIEKRASNTYKEIELNSKVLNDYKPQKMFPQEKKEDKFSNKGMHFNCFASNPTTTTTTIAQT